MVSALDVKNWFERDIRYANWNRDVEVITESDVSLEFRVYTDTNCYRVSAKVREDGTGYLGCIASARKPRAGEDWTRGNDLPDGPLSEETWRNILAAIVGYELVSIARSHKPAVPIAPMTPNADQ